MNTIHNINLEFDATVAPFEEGSFVLEAHFDIDRMRWNVIYGSTRFFEYLGMHKVFDLLSFQIHLIENIVVTKNKLSYWSCQSP